jgi:bifunctional UDP-N-acetylglucosamine pyrophosphorylase/glucosamine-1-phosphate N-acetyltransferase
MATPKRKTAAVVLAAGKGVRMRSILPKVLHLLMGRPLVSYVVDACRRAGTHRVLVVVGYQAARVREKLGPGLEYAEQTEQLGTGHALMTAGEKLRGFRGDVLVLAGDTPFLTAGVLKKLIARHKKTGASATMMTAVMDPPLSYGRIVRDGSKKLVCIVEERDATPEQKRITEVNTSHYVFRWEDVFPLLSRLGSKNDQGEYYLTDVIQMLVKSGRPVETLTADDPAVLMGINNRKHLSEAQAWLQSKVVDNLLEQGVTVVDPKSVYIEPGVRVGTDTVIHPFTTLTGRTKIGNECAIGPCVRLADTVIGDCCRVEFAVLENRKIDAGKTIGPFAFMTVDEKYVKT